MKYVWAAAAPVVLAGVFVACGGDGDDGVGAGAGTDADAGGDAAAVDPNAVVVRIVERSGFVDGKLSDKALDGYTGLAAIVTVDGVTRSIPGTINATDGVGTIPDVPRVPFVLELRATASDGRLVLRRYPPSEQRSVRVGPNYWRRGDTVAMTAGTRLGLSVTVPKGFASGDRFSWLGPQSHFVRELWWYDPADSEPRDQTNVPAANATSTTDWTAGQDVLSRSYGDEASGLPNAAAGDHLFLVQSRTGTFEGSPEAGNPWHATSHTSVVGMLEATDATFANGTTNTLRGTLAAPPTETTSLDVRHSTFAALRGLAKYPSDVWASSELYVTHEVGPGPELFLSPSIPSWSLGSGPSTFRDEGGGKFAVDPGDLIQTIDVPRLPLPGLREIVDTVYTWYFEGQTRKGSVFYSTSSTARHRRTGATITSALEIGPVQNLTVGDAALGWDGQGVVKAGPIAVRFDAPTLGTPEYYLVKLTEVRARRADDNEDSYGVAYVYTRGTNATIPAEVLRPGAMYSVSVAAIRDGRDFAEPNLTKGEDAVSTSVFSPPFLVE